MKDFWGYVSTFLSGIIAGLLIFLKVKDPDQVINNDNKIGKIKQFGDGNNSNISLPDVQAPKSRKELRQERRAERKARREARRSEREKRKYLEE